MALIVLFLGGALPWLEAIVVIPAAVIAGFNPVTSVIVAGLGNVLTVGIAAYAGERIRMALARRSQHRRRRANSEKKETPREEATRRAKGIRRRSAIERVMNRGGLPLLAIVGPLGLCTQISAIAAVASGVTATRAFLWVPAGLMIWSTVAAYLASQGLELFGVGA